MARNAATNQRIRDARRDQILRTALRVFGRRGFTATSMSDIAAAAHLSSGLLYHYFTSKDALYTELVERAARGVLEITAAAFDVPGSTWEKLRFLCEQLVAGARQDPDYALLVMHTRMSEAVPAEALAILEDLGGRNLERVTDLVRAGQEAGEVATINARELAQLFLSAIQGAAVTSRLRPDDDFPSADAFMQLFRPHR